MKSSDAEKASILGNSIKFRDQDDVKDTFVTPDLTQHPKEQETSKKLCPELRELIRMAASMYQVRNWVIVQWKS